LLTGCSTSFAPNPVQTDQTVIGKIQGVVHGGQAPVTGAQIYLYAAGTGGYGTNAVSLLTAASNTTADANGNYYVTSDSTGSFSLSGDYTCTAGGQVYLVGVGGNSGSGNNSTSNDAILQMAALGQCPSTGTMAQVTPYVTMNEISTVVMAYALGGFGTNAYNISSSSTATGQAAIANAFANIPNILNIPTGQVPGTVIANGNATVSQGKIYALANVLASCVNTANANSGACTKLFKNSTSNGTTSGTRSTNEAEAIFNIVHNPTANAATLYGMQGTTPAFSSSLSASPKDWTLPVVYSGVVSHPFNIAFDAAGTAWISDENNGVIRMTAQGAPTTFNESYVSIHGVAVDSAGNAWAVDRANNAIYVLNSTGPYAAFAGGGIDGPSSIAFDKIGNAYVANTNTAGISKFNSSGTPVRTTAYSMPTISDPLWIALDSSGNAWTPSSTGNYLGELAAGGTQGVAKSGITSSYAVAVDGSNNVWVAGTGNEIQETAGGKLLGTHTGGGLNAPYMISVDGGGNLWIANSGTSTLSAFDNTGAAITPTAGYQTGGGGACYAATVDPSGNVWTANTDGSVTVLLGLGTPTAAPMLPGQLGVEP
jgi:streptogramin lyase